ncbi:Pimeloyl-ACP methyl ester carboxylesterase [Alteribacillus persepolensis]|uniref:Pimeloyl-ACP methyl ester carboxylesterase n=1 Tax=Alteribacillus persepolensis TaxID=568899 RepID=A0A1G8B6F0_9BACI|nr:alpha/beta hydrolase [Alteribacillus persepolensis]SDH28210.1 Pimeloyl-ACP methyl ester carboxylesterase [Alteribacillus persepolensis]
MGEYVTVNNGQNLYIYRTGQNNKGTIIAAHGLTGNHKQMHFFQQAFSEDYQFISYDVRGRGLSDRQDTNTSINKHADDLVELIETLNIKEPILMGYSMGAYIAAIAASRLSHVKGLILLDGAGEADDTTRDLVIPSLGRLEKTYASAEDYVKETKHLYENLNIHWDTRLEDIARYEIKQVGSSFTHRSDYDLTKQDFESFYTFDIHGVTSSITCNTLLMIATGAMKDNKSLFTEESYHHTRNNIRHLQTEITPVNHYELVFNKQPDVLKHIQQFLTNGGASS